ncbi:probable 2-oxoglutarate-dependent dioxygenase AOP1 [Carya illinoinensis]|uniref:2-oxoglutarate-dependent dioxygenase DAO n=1 Tax=Carya illinoinensis TaxID=32201 RepID=A0A8T1Q5G4_CARIL|nr:probable 2-oxoglutarate-dependent dioxygenase AOP1 [Carya illinoinensis]KAG6649533.1 hypothetical protein CIPAW_07G218700 [Carya illinoinensis]
MGSDPESQIPVIKFSTGSNDLDRGTEGWHKLCKRVREACENYGCFEVAYDKIPTQSRAETFSAIRQLFDLPLYTKQKNVNLYPTLGYRGQIAAIPLYESLGIEDASNFESLKSFTGLMWPGGHDQFCQAVISILKSLEELNHIIVRAILDGYGLGEKTESIISCKTLLRVMRYRAPPAGEYMKGLQPHTDKIWTTILCEDEVSGLEVETKDGKWVKLSPSPGSFIFMVPDCLMAWCNCRMRAVKHRVMMSGDKDRYSFGAFAIPVDGSIIKAQKELVDEEHPQLLKEFEFTDFFRFHLSEEGRAIDSDKQVFAFAGI